MIASVAMLAHAGQSSGNFKTPNLNMVARPRIAWMPSLPDKGQTGAGVLHAGEGLVLGGRDASRKAGYEPLSVKAVADALGSLNVGATETVYTVKQMRTLGQKLGAQRVAAFNRLAVNVKPMMDGGSVTTVTGPNGKPVTQEIKAGIRNGRVCRAFLTVFDFGLNTIVFTGYPPETSYTASVLAKITAKGLKDDFGRAGYAFARDAATAEALPPASLKK